MNRDAELDAFKQINLSLVASAFGYEIVPKKSTRHSVLMASGSDKIIIAQNGKHYVYFSVHDPVSAGTAIDLVQKVIEPGCSLGRVRQILRPFLGGRHLASVQQKHQGRFQAEIHPSEPDLLAVAARYARFEPMEKPHPYLSGERGIPFELMESDRLRGRVRHCPRRQSIVFPHWRSADAADDPTAAISGYEIKGRGVNLFSKGGRKGLWISGGGPSDRVLAFAESGLDALSYLTVRGEEGTRVCSLSGQMSASQPDLIRSLISSLSKGSRLVAAFDNDLGGDKLTERLRSIATSCMRNGLVFEDDRPPGRGSDWNRIVMDAMAPAGLNPRVGPSIGR